MGYSCLVDVLVKLRNVLYWLDVYIIIFVGIFLVFFYVLMCLVVYSSGCVCFCFCFLFLDC